MWKIITTCIFTICLGSYLYGASLEVVFKQQIGSRDKRFRTRNCSPWMSAMQSWFKKSLNCCK